MKRDAVVQNTDPVFSPGFDPGQPLVGNLCLLLQIGEHSIHIVLKRDKMIAAKSLL